MESTVTNANLTAVTPVVTPVVTNVINCVICLNDIKKSDDVTVTPCIHLYHKECLAGWLDAKDNRIRLHIPCPLCKSDIASLIPNRDVSNLLDDIDDEENDDVAFDLYIHNAMRNSLSNNVHVRNTANQTIRMIRVINEQEDAKQNDANNIDSNNIDAFSDVDSDELPPLVPDCDAGNEVNAATNVNTSENLDNAKDVEAARRATLAADADDISEISEYEVVLEDVIEDTLRYPRVLVDPDESKSADLTSFAYPVRTMIYGIRSNRDLNSENDVPAGALNFSKMDANKAEKIKKSIG